MTAGPLRDRGAVTEGGAGHGPFCRSGRRVRRRERGLLSPLTVPADVAEEKLQVDLVAREDAVVGPLSARTGVRQADTLAAPPRPPQGAARPACRPPAARAVGRVPGTGPPPAARPPPPPRPRPGRSGGRAPSPAGRRDGRRAAPRPAWGGVGSARVSRPDTPAPPANGARAAATSPGVAGRAAGSFASIRPRRAARAGGPPGRWSRTAGTGAVPRGPELLPPGPAVAVGGGPGQEEEQGAAQAVDVGPGVGRVRPVDCSGAM